MFIKFAAFGMVASVLLITAQAAAGENTFAKRYPECANARTSEKICYATDTPISNLPGQAVRQVHCYSQETRCGKLYYEWVMSKSGQEEISRDSDAIAVNRMDDFYWNTCKSGLPPEPLSGDGLLCSAYARVYEKTPRQADFRNLLGGLTKSPLNQ